MATIATRVRTVFALGLANVLRAVVYRTRLRLGLHPVQHVFSEAPSGPFFGPPKSVATDLPSFNMKPQKSFGWRPTLNSEQPPDWHTNVITGVRLKDSTRLWWQIPDFDPDVGDIKTIWEASRFGWVISFAQQARLGDPLTLSKLNLWLMDWCSHNPPYKGPNWKCGQEASLRVIHLAAGAILLEQVDGALPGLADLVEASLKRIAPTRSYAIAQDNNHGTSEAAALFVGGHWLARSGRKEGLRWADMGRRLLENRVGKLILPDGTFSQYSVVYHRLMLDVLSFSEFWRQRYGLPAFSDRFGQRCAAATHWLHAIVDPMTGDAPNIGANDGAQVLDFAQIDYRDFRPSVQLAAAIFLKRDAYGDQDQINSALNWLSIARPALRLAAPASTMFGDGGFAVMREDSATAILRYPRFRFRPGQADALHVDLTIGGLNHLRDGGTYSYNDGQKWIDYFGGVRSHNTVEFDGHDQMPRLGRFLYGDWLKTDSIEPIVVTDGGCTVGAGYHNANGRHFRNVHLARDELIITDELDSFSVSAVVRWRLMPGEWEVDDNLVKCRHNQLFIRSTVPILRFELGVGWESRYYLQRSNLPVLEVEIGSPGTLTTTYSWMR